MKKLTQEEFISKAVKVHGEKYGYKESVYKGSNTIVKVMCNKHKKLFNITPMKLFQGRGCVACGRERTVNGKKLNTKLFIEKAKKIHGSKYDYSKVNYTLSCNKVEIICMKHKSIFTQQPNGHLNGCGCPVCANEYISILSSINPNGWSKHKWKEKGLASSNFDGFKVYVVMCWDGTEVFYKIGRTYTTIEKRFNKVPYNYDVVSIIEHADSDKMFDLENELKRQHKMYKYIPEKKFTGRQECFSKINLT